MWILWMILLVIGYFYRIFNAEKANPSQEISSGILAGDERSRHNLEPSTMDLSRRLNSDLCRCIRGNRHLLSDHRRSRTTLNRQDRRNGE